MEIMVPIEQIEQKKGKREMAEDNQNLVTPRQALERRKIEIFRDPDFHKGSPLYKNLRQEYWAIERELLKPNSENFSGAFRRP
jgi:hypothetical protein